MLLFPTPDGPLTTMSLPRLFCPVSSFSSCPPTPHCLLPVTYSTFCTCSLIRSMAVLISTTNRTMSPLLALEAIVLASRSIS